MKILLSVPYFVPAWSFGGPVKVVYDLAKQLISFGHEVTVITTDVLNQRERQKQKTDRIDNIEVIYFRNLSNVLAYRYNFYYPLGASNWLKNNIRQYDIVHCHEMFHWLNVQIAKECEKTNVPFIVQAHGSMNKVRVEAKLTFVKKLFYALYPKILGSAAALIVSTEQERAIECKAYHQWLRKHTYVVPNGVPIQQITFPSRNDEDRKKIGIAPGGKFILYFGRIQFIKGIDITIRALSLITNIRYKYIIIGRDEGELSKLLKIAKEKNVIDRIIVLGPLFGDALKIYIRNADLFVFNSRSEGFPMAVLDACAAGLPVILSKECNVPEVEQWGAGIMLENNTPEATASAIQHFFQHPELQKTMQQQAHELIRQRFNTFTVTNQYLSIYKEIVLATRTRSLQNT